LLEELTSAQISEWEAYDRVDPIGKWRDELSIASLTSVVVNLARQLYHDPKKSKPTFVSPNDFMINWGEVVEPKPEPEKQTPEEMFQILSGLAQVQGTRDKIEKK
jgi:hypothetical protein